MMNEIEILNTIKQTTKSTYIGDDCAYIKDLGIVITQDSLVEDVHFKRDWCTPYQLGYKSVAVNISDILASGAKPAFITTGLSLPNNLSYQFVEEFYSGVNAALHGAKIVGGDITGSVDKIFISISAIGTTNNRNISSRKNAKSGYILITKGLFGSSAAGLNELLNGGSNKELIEAHLEPQLEYDFSEIIATTVKEPYAMMDTSDGIADALFKIAEASKVKAVVNYDSIPHLVQVNKNKVLYGGEDYNIIAAVPAGYLSKITGAILIGKIEPFDGIRLDISGETYTNYNELRIFNHFGDNNG